jgi:hypothetical protein
MRKGRGDGAGGVLIGVIRIRGIALRMFLVLI